MKQVSIILLALLASFAAKAASPMRLQSGLLMTPAALPGACARGEMRFDIATSLLQVCVATNTWSPMLTASPSNFGRVLFSLGPAIPPAWTTQPVLGNNGDETGKLGFAGATSGLIAVQPQNAAGTYNFNLPTTAGSAGQVLTSQGGGSSAMTWTTATNANTANAIVKRDASGDFSAGTIAASGVTASTIVAGSLGTSGTLQVSTLTGPLKASSGVVSASNISLTSEVTNTLPVANGGTGRATLTSNAILLGSGTGAVGQVSPGGAGTVLIGSSGAPVYSMAPTIGASGASSGTIALAGVTSGAVTIQPQNAAGTYNFNLPTTAGSNGQVLTSAGGGSSAMTWTSPLTNPMTTTGDIIYSSDNSGTAARLAAGNANEVLTMASGIPAWKTKLAGIVSKTTTYTATTSDDVILCDTSGGAWTLSLYTASGNTGRVLKIIKTSSDFNALTIDANGSQTIRGKLTFLSHTKGESVTIESDGSNWQVIDRYIPSEWVSYTPALASNGGGGITLDTGTGHTAINGYWRRVGDSAEISFGFRNGQGGAASGAAGSVLVGIPSGLTIAGVKVAANGLTTSAFQSVLLYTGSAFQTSTAYYATTSSIAFVNHNAPGSVTVASLVAGAGVSGTVRVPISGWEP
jgi:hypothetical protein